MWFTPPPTDDAIRAWLARQPTGAFSYREVGALRGASPAGYDLDHNRARLGEGEAAFEAACAALRSWRMFPAPWTKISPADAPIREGNRA